MNIHEVAKAAGVSIATVSRVVNHPESVSAKTRERVLAVMSSAPPSDRDYRGRILARRFAIAVVIPSVCDYRQTYEGAQSVADGRNYSVQLCVTGCNDGRLLRCVKSLAAQQVDGVILAAENNYAPALHVLQESGIPFVCIGGRPIADCGNSCYIHYEDSADKLARYLAELGCETVCVVTSRAASNCRDALSRGFRGRWAALGREDGQLTFAEAESSVKGGYQFARYFFQTHSTLPDAIVCQHDEVAAGLMKAASEYKLSIPKQLRVVGFHDAQLSAAVTPELTTVDQPTFRLGMAAARRLFDIISDSEYFDIESQEIVLKGRLKIRKSCGNKKAIYELYE